MRLAFGDFDMAHSVAAPPLIATVSRWDPSHRRDEFSQKHARLPCLRVRTPAGRKNLIKLTKLAGPPPRRLSYVHYGRRGRAR
jgi:hypothetical protein